MRGEVVGINSQIYSRSGGFMGISFAIPMDEAIRVSDQLRASGRVSRGRIGVQIDQVTKDVAESIGLGKPQARWCGAWKRVRTCRQGGRGGRRHHHQVRRQAHRKGHRSAALVGSTKPGTKST
jgi:serine protease Do